MKIDGAWRTRPETVAVLDALTARGHRALFVGGCVRNALLDAPVADTDIATDARPEQVIDLAAEAGLKSVPTGIEHGTVTVVSGGVGYEVTTFRRDVETFGRHAKVAYSTLISDDARRRDFTMNALYAEPDGSLVDPLGGLPDALARRVRFIEDPTARIREDYLRILRFFRFHAWYGDPAQGLDAEGLAACAAEAEGLERLSRERVGAEMLKLLAAPDPAPALAAFAATGGLARILAGADPRPLPVLVALETEAGLAPDPLRRLALLGAAGAPECLRLSNAQAKRLAAILEALPEAPAAAAYRHGAQVALDAALVAAASLGTRPPADLQAQATRGAAARFPIAAQDLMPRLQGAALGAELRRLESLWIASDFTMGRAALLAADPGTDGGDIPPRIV